MHLDGVAVLIVGKGVEFRVSSLRLLRFFALFQGFGGGKGQEIAVLGILGIQHWLVLIVKGRLHPASPPEGAPGPVRILAHKAGAQDLQVLHGHLWGQLHLLRLGLGGTLLQLLPTLFRPLMDEHGGGDMERQEHQDDQQHQQHGNRAALAEIVDQPIAQQARNHAAGRAGHAGFPQGRNEL